MASPPKFLSIFLPYQALTAYMTGRGDAVTIHSLLELPPGNDEEPHVKPVELSCDYLIIDEFSMVGELDSMEGIYRGGCCAVFSIFRDGQREQ